MIFDIGLHEVCVRVGVLYVITKFSRMDSLPNFLTHGAPLRARGSSAIRVYLVNVGHDDSEIDNYRSPRRYLGIMQAAEAAGRSNFLL